MDDGLNALWIKLFLFSKDLLIIIVRLFISLYTLTRMLRGAQSNRARRDYQ
jgi:hypothetical protein